MQTPACQPKFFPQENPWACGAACLRMVAAPFRITADEPQLLSVCKFTDKEGIHPVNLAEGARKIGLNAEFKEDWTLERIDWENTYVIVSLSYRPIDGSDRLHFVLLKEIVGSKIIVLEPARKDASGEVAIDMDVFERAWGLAFGFCIVVNKCTGK